MNELIIFNNSKFGEVRTIKENNIVLFCGKDVTSSLGYKDATNAMKQHCRGVVKCHLTDSLGRTQVTNFIPEGDIYRLAAKSELSGADEFERWIFDEVLPSIRKTGKYEAPQLRNHSLGETNAAARIINKALEKAGMAPQFIAVALKSLYAPVGIEIPLIGITTGKRTYDSTAIAQRLGIMSKSGNPHNQAVSAIISQIDIKASEKEIVPFQDQASGHSGTNVQYAESVVDKVTLWLQRNNYPVQIATIEKTFGVIYKN